MSWEQELASALRSVGDLVAEGFLTSEEAKKIDSIAQKYQFLLPRYYAGLIDKKDPNCPIRLQAIPHFDEDTPVQYALPDPLQDLKHQPVQRITHRYKNRVLLHLTPNCSMYCRFCFRKTLLNELKGDLFSGGLKQAFDYLQSHSEIREVILSGGDPLMAGEGAISQVLTLLADIDSIKRVRFHTRVPVTLPSRITYSLIAVLGSTRFKPVIVTHFNHPKELTEQAKKALRLLKGVAELINQSVLLKKVNDKSDVLVELSEKLFEAGVLPYYLHQMDPAEGTQHFYVDKSEGKQILEQMRTRLPGYLVPRYVMDIIGDPYKREVMESL